jgi:hypothetical protein
MFSCDENYTNRGVPPRVMGVEVVRNSPQASPFSRYTTKTTSGRLQRRVGPLTHEPCADTAPLPDHENALTH